MEHNHEWYSDNAESVIVGVEDVWAIVELMGHSRTAGRISQPGNFGGMLRVDVPIEDGFRTEFYGVSAIYSIRLVSEEIARAYAVPERGEYTFDAPIVPREMYESALREMRTERERMQREISVLSRRLTAITESDVKALVDGDADGEWIVANRGIAKVEDETTS